MNGRRKLSRANRNAPRPANAGQHETVPLDQTKATKALVAAVVTLLGLFGITVTQGTAQLIVMVAQLVLVVYGVWRARNVPKDHPTDLSDIT